MTDLDNLEAEVHLMPLHLRRKLLALNYFGKVYRLPSHPVKVSFENFHHFQFYDIRPHALPVVGRVHDLARNLNLPMDSIEKINSIDLYLPIKINIKFNLLRNKRTCSSIQFQQEYRRLAESTYLNFNKIFTDGSKTGDGCGCAFFADINPPVTVGKRLPDTCGIFNAELYAILLALQFINNSPLNNFVIFSDSYSALQSLKSS